MCEAKSTLSNSAAVTDGSVREPRHGAVEPAPIAEPVHALEASEEIVPLHRTMTTLSDPT
jgi:hypothetical protein